MKKKEFNELLQGVRELGLELRGNRRVVMRTDRIESDSVAIVRAKLKLSQAETLQEGGHRSHRSARGGNGSAEPRGATTLT